MRKLSGQEMAKILNDLLKKCGVFQPSRRMPEKVRTSQAWFWHKWSFVPRLGEEGVKDCQSIAEGGVFLSFKTHTRAHATYLSSYIVSTLSIIHRKCNFINTHTHTHTTGPCSMFYIICDPFENIRWFSSGVNNFKSHFQGPRMASGGT